MLAGSLWQFTEIDEAVPASRNARLALEEDRLGANVGCNGMGGPWRIEDGRLIAGPLVQTKMYCQGPVMEQERAVSAMLAGAPRIEVHGRKLVINSSGHSAVLERVEPD